MARFERQVSSHRGTFPAVCARGQLLEQAYCDCKKQKEVVGLGNNLSTLAAWGPSDRTDPLE